MKIIESKFIYSDGEFLIDSAVVFNDKIIKVGLAKDIKDEYKDAELISIDGNCILYPGFINAHTHLEFSANRSKLKLGSFIEWLYSVFEYRDELVESLNYESLEAAAKEMLSSGVTTFGAISSFGVDLDICVKTPQRVIYFNEVIGSSPAMVDTLFNDFKARLEESIERKSSNFYPAIAIHSPYSVHPILIREVINIAKSKDIAVSAHFLESKSEREWLESSSGEFKELFENYFKTSTPVNSIDGFLDAFKGIKTLFTHVTLAKESEFNKINSENSSIIHCPRSNILLGNGKLDIKNVDNLLLGTDGLSSNYSLSILDELKSALMLHCDIEAKKLATILIKAVTINAAKALDLNVGDIKKGNFADFALFELTSDLSDFSDGSLALNTILHSTKAKEVYIGGVKY